MMPNGFNEAALIMFAAYVVIAAVVVGLAAGLAAYLWSKR